MAKAFGKHSESKRLTCHKKYKIRKKVREHNKKLAKNVKTGMRQKRKLATVPNKAPFKNELLLDAIQQTEAKDEARKLKKKIKAPLIITKQISEKPVSVAMTAAHSAVVISKSDILLWIIDVRSPIECYSEDVLKEIRDAGKDLFFVLNKIDIVPTSIVLQWYAHFSSISKTFLMKSTEVVLTEVEQILPANKRTVNKFGGAKFLLSSLKQAFTENKVIGVIGATSVGKSCVISSLLKACGRTKKKRTTETKINENLQLITQPGLISVEYSGMLSVFRKLQQYMNQPVVVLRALAQHISRSDAMQAFTLPSYQHPEGMCEALAVRYNMYCAKKPDLEAAGRLVLKQLRDKQMKFFVTPPTGILAGKVPDDVVNELKLFLYTGSALPISPEEFDIVIVRKEKKKKGAMDVDEEMGSEGESGSGEESGSDDGEYAESDSGEEMC